MRDLTVPLQDIFQKRKKGVEPVLVLGIEWEAGYEVLYADRKINGADQPFPIIVNIGGFNTSQIVSGSGSTEKVSIVMSDIEDGDYTGHLKNIIDTTDVHKAKARMYLTAQGANLIDKTLLFQGEINSPLEWDEGDRTLSFDIVSQVESVEAGFAIEDGDFPIVPDELRGKPWPMVFGEVCWMKAVQVRAARKGFLVDGQGVVDFTLPQRLCQARQLTCAQKYDPPRTDQNVGGSPTLEDFGCMHFRDNRTGDKGCICPDLPFGTCPQGNELAEEEPIDTECLTRRFNEICKLLTRQAQENALVQNPMSIRGGNSFPQNQTITININGVLFTGVMVGETFTWTTVKHPQVDDISNPPCRKIGEATYGWRRGAPTDGWNRTSGNGRSYEFGGSAITASTCSGGGDLTKKVVDGAGESWRYYQLFTAADFIWLPAGSEVYLESESEILHIANLFGGTITGVAAYRNYNGTVILTNLPTSYYTVRLTDYGAYSNVLEVSLTKPLNTYKDEDWETDIYVRVVSPVGPNPADCIKHLVDTYLATSGITMDATSYASVRTKVDNYPTNFHVTARPSVFDLIADIAYQSRCAAVIRDGKLVLIYLSEKPTAIRTLTMADIIPQSLRITHGDTEDLNTRHDITWRNYDASQNKDDDPDRNLLLKWNVPLYGTHKVEYTYYTQNIFDTILKSATFWMIREATTWKYIHFETPLTQIDLDIFDAIALNIPTFTTNITVVVEQAQYNADTNTIAFKCWTPIRAGETDEYIWAWPAQQDANEKFPLQGIDDGRAGDALGFTVTPPLGHVLSGGFSVQDPSRLFSATSSDPTVTSTVQTTGDRNPSDLDDVEPSVVCPPAADNVEVIEPPTFDDFAEVAARQDAHFENNQDSFPAGGGGSTDDDNERIVCKQPHPSDTCTYTVTLQYITPTSVTTTQPEGSTCNSGGPCGCGVLGRPCTGTFNSFCHTFGALWAAQQFRDQKLAERDDLFENCRYECGENGLWQVGGVTAIPGSGGFGECEDTNSVGDPNAPGAQDGEIAAPAAI